MTALPDFLPGAEEIKLDRRNLRIVYQLGSRVEACVLEGAVWGVNRRKGDLAVFTITAQDPTDKTLLRTAFRLSNISPAVGELVGVAGYGSMETVFEERNGPLECYGLSRRLVLRAGRVKAIHTEGHALCRTPCIEITAPVFPGMSGGPAFTLGLGDEAIAPFGVISTGIDLIEAMNDPSHVGSTFVSLLPIEIVGDPNAQNRPIRFRFSDARVARNPKLDRNV
jgi:hypothetical protein